MISYSTTECIETLLLLSILLYSLYKRWRSIKEKGQLVESIVARVPLGERSVSEVLPSDLILAEEKLPPAFSEPTGDTRNANEKHSKRR